MAVKKGKCKRCQQLRLYLIFISLAGMLLLMMVSQS